MKEKKVYTPPTLSSEALAIGVFGNYGSGSGEPEQPFWVSWFWWIFN